MLLALGAVSEPAGGPGNVAPPTSSERDAKYYQSLNIAYLAVDLGQDVGMVAKDYPALKPAWVQKRMGRSDVSEKEMLDFIIQEVRHQDLLRKALERDQDRRSVIKGINDKKGGVVISPGGDMVAGTNKIAERGTGGEFMLRDAAMLRPALHHAGNSEVYLESPDIMMARKKDASGSFTASVHDGIAFASSPTGDYVPQSRDANESAAWVELRKKRLATEAKYQTWAQESLRRREAFSELVAARRDQIVGSTKSNDEMEALLLELAQTSRDWGEREQERLREQATEADHDVQNSLLSVRRFDSFLETAGYRGGAAALVEQKEQEAIEQDAEAVLVDRMLGAKGIWNSGEGGDPRACLPHGSICVKCCYQRLRLC
ncbi:hypothetical protein [Verrucomicrobium spinosum]|uniref:hypothetical protein n=1 Tax=Verrucomicrobium spinosum TaxID=2736 RepID=UPI000A78098B|nr:hypothetical protein [Verrucomicrobium spinosum]